MKKVTAFLTNNIAITILILMIIIATVLDSSFLAPANLFNVFNQNSIKGIMAIGMTFVILNGYFDMSLCTLLSLTAALSCGLQNQIGIFGAVLVSLLVGALVGVINGFLIAYVGINGFVVTLATMLGCRGLAYIYPNEKSIVAPNMNFLKFGIGKLGPLTYTSWLFLILMCIAYFVLRYTSHGRNTYAAGGNANAAANAGIDVKKTIFINFVIVGVGSALGGVLYAASLGSSSPALGWPDMHMLVIASCVLGGAKLSGGYGNIWFSMIGVMILGIVINIMSITGAAPWVSTFCTGAIMIAVLIADKFITDARNAAALKAAEEAFK
ncbi:MAG: ABC transporter permease [Lachnospiraceae bacterium]|nr:ABC transporter permease [Lachnospiraceae bacterium]